MSRRIEEVVEVRVADEEAGTPLCFLWRGRLYQVRDVLGHWRERTSWWTGAAARAVHGDASGPEAALLDREREVWRVVAGSGRMHGTGVYDLVRHEQVPVGVAAGTGAAEGGEALAGGWVLFHVAD
jgi:hypothetical protein